MEKRLLMAAMGVTLLAAALTTPLAAQQAVSLDASSTLSYTGRHPAHSWTGTSRQVTGTLTFDPARPAQTRITVVVPVESFDSGNASRDSNMLDAVEVEDYPEVRFEGTTVEVVEWAPTAEGYAGMLRVRGQLTFHGRTNLVEMLVAVRVVGSRFEAEARFSITLSRYDVKRPRLLFRAIDDAIELEAHLVAGLR